MGVSGPCSLTGSRADGQRDAAGQREAAENRRQRNRLLCVRDGVDGPEVQHRLAARVPDAQVREGYQSHRDEHYPDDDEREFHGLSPLDCFLTLSVATSLCYWTLVQSIAVPTDHSTDRIEQ